MRGGSKQSVSTPALKAGSGHGTVPKFPALPLASPAGHPGDGVGQDGAAGVRISCLTALLAGTLEERGLLSELVPRKAGAATHQPQGERNEARQAYRLPAGLRGLLPFSYKAFPCCFLCPGSEEEEEKEEEGSCVTEEGTAAPGEGTQLLPKPGSRELQPAGRLSETGMSAWHSVA